MWYVYILKCCDNSYYSGTTSDLEARVYDHNRGKGSAYTRLRRPVTLVYFEEIATKKLAELREIEIKRFSRRNKERFIQCGKGVRVSLAPAS